MKNIKLLVLVAITMLVSTCQKDKSPTTSDGPPVSLLEVTKVLRSAENKFIEFNSLAPGEPKKAIEQTKEWLLTQSTVESAETVDSIYINIFLKSGLQTAFFLKEVDADGFSVFRGGGNAAWGVRLEAAGKKSKHTIENKDVLIYAPAYSEFYKPEEMQKITDLLNRSGVVAARLMKDQECSYEKIATFKDYGFVIMDTHGMEDAFLVGTKIDTIAVDDEEILKEKISAAAGPDAYAKIQANELRLSKTSRYTDIKVDGKVQSKRESYYQLWATSKYINELPKMTETVIFGNMCYSGYAAPLKNGNMPIRTAFVNRNPISYYCYARDNNYSSPVENTFSKAMEDSLVRSLVVDGDSTGIAHLDYEANNFYDKYILKFNQGRVYLFLRQFGSFDYSYNSCVNVFTDNRDGIIYKAVCIGKQSWMAENLRYNAPGSVFYNNDPLNGSIYGKLYDWNTVMNGAASSNTNPSGVQGICPKGWHLPSQAEWIQLTDFLGGADQAGKVLKSDKLWYENGNGTNASGFTALPSGIYNGIHWNGLKEAAYFWSTTESSSDISRVQILYLGYINQKAALTTVVKTANGATDLLAPCRCLKDK